MHPVVRVVVLGCSQDAGVPQMGCSCHQCDRARRQPSYKDGMVTCLGIVDEEESKSPKPNGTSTHDGILTVHVLKGEGMSNSEVFIVDATPDLRKQLWAIQHPEQEGSNNRPLELGGILLTHAHTGHYTGLLQLGKEGADTRDIPVFCTPSMAAFLRGNQPWAQLVKRRNISIREVLAWNKNAPMNTRLTSLVSFMPVLVPHRAELSDTVAYFITASRSHASEGNLVPDPEPLAGIRISASECDGGAGTGDTLKVFYCPDTDGWSGWEKDIREWCNEVDVALVDGTFYDKHELKGRDMSEVSHPVVQETVKVLADCGTEVVLTHFNHTNPILSKESLERAAVLAKGFKNGMVSMPFKALRSWYAETPQTPHIYLVATFGMEWTLKG